MAATLLAPIMNVLPAAALTVSPVVIEHEADPGDEIVGTIKLHNEGTNTETYYPSVQDFVGSDESGTPEFVGVNPDRSLVEWVRFSRSSMTIDSGDGDLVVYTIKVPKDAAPGGYFGGLLFSTSPANATFGVGTVGVTGPLLLLRVSGNVVERASIASFASSQDSGTSLPVDFKLRVQNEGTVHVKPAGVIRITNLFGGVSAVIPVNAAGGNVLPGGTRAYSESWVKEQLPDNASELMKEWKNFGFGPYTATLILNYGEGKQVMSASDSFWVMPWMLIALFVVLVAVLVLLVLQYNKWIIARAMKGMKRK
ncbi:hypothetical protein A2856_01315 [Candidatus Uhrbacteria bacterium RIFCSPHIGHO2_01_FULL_63_20]|uniref:DUF916 domain-containing protein n=1 Tax=Candidatus Uhrbacteria bacterium RIFCSPHIGHO2_01_FULL_63_20 TaxID=1802385 RepID=A0A1F7TMT9_9BACT|nr:MAG: hypothetical protein A2856_01315 [Candidatus Uhrbacteria bacterium RIFCSPHIGHO2_01_FULL_63_20]